MTTEHPDYWSGIIPGQAIFGEGQTTHTENEEKDVAANDSEDVIQYTVPTGYEYHITSIGICNNFPGFTRYQILVNDVEMGGAYYDTFRRVPLVPEAAFVIPAGVKYGIRLYNDDDVSHSFTATIYGFLVEV